MNALRRVEAASPHSLAAVAATFAAILLVPFLGGDFVGDDEALDAGVVHAIVESGDWLHPEFNDSYLPPKPPLSYWLGALVALAAGGLEEWTVRLPSAIAAIATVYATVAFGAGAVGRGGAILGGVFLALMPVFRDQARLGRADMTMAFLVVVALCLYASRAGPLSRRERWIVHALLGLAALAKGAAGVGMVAAVVAVDAWRGGAAGRGRARSLLDPSLAAFVVIGGFWYALGVAHWGDRFLFHHVIGENFRHFFGSWVAEEKPVRGLLHHLSHFVNVFTGTLPWGLLLPAVLLDPEARGTPNARERFLRHWIVAGFVFFTLATRKSPYYLLPIFPPIALLVGGFAWRRIVAGDRERMPRETVRRAALAGALLAAAGALGWIAIGAPGLGATRSEVLAVLGDAAFVSALLLVSAGAASAVALAGLLRGRARACFGAAVVAAFAASQLANRLEPGLAAASSLRRFGEEVGRTVPSGRPVYFFEMPLPAVVLYAGRTIPVLEADDGAPAEPFHLVVPESLAPRLPQIWARGEIVVTDRARVFTRRRMEIRLLRIPGERRQGVDHRGEAAGSRARRAKAGDGVSGTGRRRPSVPGPASAIGSGGVTPAGRLVALGRAPLVGLNEPVQKPEQAGSERDRREHQRPGDVSIDESFGG